jgi:hypothetical protein
MTPFTFLSLLVTLLLLQLHKYYPIHLVFASGVTHDGTFDAQHHAQEIWANEMIFRGIASTDMLHHEDYYNTDEYDGEIDDVDDDDDVDDEDESTDHYYYDELAVDSIDEEGNVLPAEATYIAKSPGIYESPTNNEMHNIDLGVAQVVDANLVDEITARIQQSRHYMIHEVMNHTKKYRKVQTRCKNKHENCAFWGVMGECENNPAYMTLHCAPVCHTCHLLHVETRCPLDPTVPDALYPGDVNRLFEKLVSDPLYAPYGIQVHSRPTYAVDDTIDTASYAIGPWVITLENAISDQEADRLIELGMAAGYERSSDVGIENDDGTYTAEINQGRTSTNACKYIYTQMDGFSPLLVMCRVSLRFLTVVFLY